MTVNIKKRVLCLLLVLCFAVSMSAMAFADRYDCDNQISDSANEAMDEGYTDSVVKLKFASSGQTAPYYASGHFTSTADFISDSVKSAYMDRMISYYIKNGELQSTLSAGKPVLMFFEGGSDTGKCEVSGERTGAVCLVIRNDGSENYIAYYCKLCGTLPDYPFGYSYDNGHYNYGAATLIDGIYSIYTVNHRGIYAGFNTRTGSNQCLPCVYMDCKGGFSVLNGNGINVHTRLKTTVSGDVNAPYSAGCLVIAGDTPFDAYNEFLQQSVPDTSALTDTTFGGGDIKKYNSSEETAAGMLVMDRYLAKETMLDIYGGNSEAVACITEFSTSAQADEASESACINNCTVYPSYLTAKVGEGKALMSLPANGTPAAYTNSGTLTVTALYKNSDGEYWYRVYCNTDSYYIKSSDVSKATCLYDDVSIHNYTYPVVKQYQKAFSVSGIVSSRYNKLKSVNGYILSPDGETECSKSVTSILRSYSIDASDGWTAYRYSLDNLMAFSGLSLGEHRYKISATVDNYYVSGNELKTDTREIVLINKTFTVAESESVSKTDVVKQLSEPSLTVTNNASTGKIVLKWTAVEGADKYSVYSSSDGGETYKRLITTTKTSITNTSAKAGKTYYYKVKAQCDNGLESGFSNIVYRTCDCASPVVKAGNVASTGKITLKWEKISGAEKYVVYRASSKNGEYKKILTTTKTSMTNTSTVAGKTYYYKVKALSSVKSSANSAYSTVISRTCDCARPSVSVTVSNGHPKLTWKAVTNADKYVVYYSYDGETYNTLTTTSKLTITHTKAKAGKTCYYKVKAIQSKTSAASSAFSKTVSVKIN